MSNTVDNRVVEMQFKNEDFERGIKQTITSLDGLKKALEINTNSLDLSRVQREADNLNLSKVTAAVESLSARFSNLGIVGMTVMQRLTNSAINLAEKLGSASIGQILTGGKGRAQKVADARFKLEGLMRDFKDSGERIKTVFDSAKDAVNDTAFGLDEAVNISAMLVGSGVEYEKMAGEVSDLDTALMGIAGAAAMSNSSFEDIGRIFAQVKTAGRLMGQDMMQLQGRTINVTAEIAKYLKITQAEVQEMVHKGEIDFNTFAAAMNNSFGEQAKKSNETLQGVLSNVRAALSKIGEIFFSGIIENKELIAFFGNLKDRLNQIKNAMEPLKQPFYNLIASFGKLGSAILGTMNIGKSGILNGFINTLANVFEKVSNFIDTITSKISGFAEKMHLTEAAEEVKETVEKIDDSVQMIKEIASTIWFGDPETGENPYGNGQTRVDALGNMYERVQAYVNAMKEADFDMEKADQIYAQNAVASTEQVTDAKQREMEARLGLNKVSDESVENAEKTTQAFSPLMTVLGNIMKGIAAIGRAFKKVFSVKDLKASIGQLTSSFGKVVAAIGMTEERVTNLESFFTGLFSIFKIAGDALVNLVSDGFNVLANILPTIIDGISRFIGFIGNAINSFREFIESNNLIVRAGKFVATTFTKVSSTLKEFFSRFVELPAVQKLKAEFIDIYERVGAKLLEWFGLAKDSMSSFFGSFDDVDDSKMNLVLNSINTALETMMNLTTDAKGGITKFFDKFKQGGELENTAKYLEKVEAGYQGVKKTSDALSKSKSVGEFISNMRTAVGGAGGGGGVFGQASGALDRIKESFKNLDLAKMTLIGLSGSLVAASLSFSYLTFNITDAIKAFSEFPKQFVGVFKSIRGAFDGVKEYFKRKGLAQIITQAAIALGVFAASLAFLAIVGNKYDLMKPAYAMTMIMGTMTVMIAIIAQLTKSTKSAKKFNDMMDAFSKIMLSMSGSVFLLAAAMSVLSEIKWSKDAFISLGVIVGLMAALIGVTAIISKMGPEIKSSGLWLIFYAGSVWLLVKALNSLAKLDIENLKGKMLVLAEAMGIVSMIAVASSHMSLGKGLSVIALIGSIILMELALKWLIKYGLKKSDIETNKDALMTAMAGLVLLAGYMIIVSHLIKKPEGVAASIIATVVAIIAITSALKKISKIPLLDLIPAVAALVILMAAVAGLIFTIGMYGQGSRIKQAGTTILKIAAAMAILGLVVTYLGYLPREVVKDGMGTVVQLAALMAGLIYVTKFAGKVDPKAFIAMIGVMATLALLVSLMSFIPDKMALLQAAGILGLTLVAFGASMYLASKEANKTSVKPLNTMIRAVLVIGGMLIGLSYLNKGDYMTMLSSAAAMSMVLIALGECARLMMSAFASKGVGPAAMKEINKTILVMTVVVGAIGGMLSLLTVAAKGNWATVLASAGAIMAVMFVMAEVMKLINKEIPGGVNDIKKLKAKLDSLKYLLAAMAVIGGLVALISFAGGSNWATVGMAAVAMIGVMAAMTLVYFALSKIPADGKTMIAKAGALALMSTALIPAAIALSLLTQYDFGSIMNAAAGLAAVIGAISLALGLLVVVSEGGGIGIVLAVAGAIVAVALSLAASVYIIAKAIDVVVKAIEQLSKIDYNKIDIKTLNTLVGLFLKFSLVSFVAAAGIAAISVALTMLALALAIAALGITPLVIGVTKLIEAITNFLKVVKDMGLTSKKISGALDNVGDSIGALIKKTAVAFALGFALFIETLALKARIIGNAIKDFIITVIDIVAEVGTDIKRHILEGLSDMFEMLEDVLPELFEHFNNVLILCLSEIALNAKIYGILGSIIAVEFLSGLMDGLASKSEDLIDSAVWLALSLIKAIRDTFSKYKDIIGDSVESAYSKGSAKLWKFIEVQNGITNPLLAKFARDQADFLEQNAEITANSLDNEINAMAEARGKNNIEAYKKGQDSATAKLDYNNIKYMTEAKQKEALDHSDEAGQTGEDMIQSLISSAEGAANGMDSTNLVDTLRNYYQNAIGGGAQRGFEEAKTITAEEFKNYSEQAQAAILADGYKWNDAGTALVKEVSSGVSDTIEGQEGKDVLGELGSFLGIDGGTDGIGGVLESFAGTMTDSADESGGNFIDGLFNKLTDPESINLLETASSHDAQAIVGAFNSGLKIESPSKVAMESADYWVQGLLYMASNVNTKKLSEAAISNANSIMNSFDTAFNAPGSEAVYTPTIRPVLDSNNMGQYSGLMGVLNNQGTVRLAADSQVSINNANQLMLTQQIEALRTDINKLANTDFSHMMDGVAINVNADTTVDGTVLRKTASNYTIGQINRKEQGYMMATGGRF